MSANFMATLANVSGSLLTAKQALVSNLCIEVLTAGNIQPDKKTVELLIAQAPNKIALSNSVLLLDLINPDDESAQGLLALYESRLNAFQTKQKELLQ